MAADDLSSVDQVISELAAARQHIDAATEEAEAFLGRYLAGNCAEEIALMADDVEATSLALAAELERVRAAARVDLAEMVRQDARKRLRRIIDGGK